MSYDLYMNGVLYPVAPSKIQLKIGNNNKTIDLINEGEVNVIKTAGLQEISFDLLLPAFNYPFCAGGVQGVGSYVEQLKSLKTSGATFQFILSRRMPNGNNMHNTNITVTMEDLTITDDAKEGFDSKATVKLKEYRPYGTKSLKISKASNTATITEERTAGANEPQSGGTYTVQKGDSLWKIAQQHYGKGSDYTKIYNGNNGQISNPNLIYPGQVLKIP